jgi:hypothetical protein
MAFLNVKFTLQGADAPRQPPFSAWLCLAPHPPLPPQIILSEVCAGPTTLPALGFRGQERFGLSVLIQVISNHVHM